MAQYSELIFLRTHFLDTVYTWKKEDEDIFSKRVKSGEKLDSVIFTLWKIWGILHQDSLKGINCFEVVYSEKGI